MKKNNLLVLLLFLFSLKGNCQYNQTIIEGSVWNVNYYGLGAFNYSEAVAEDTLVNGYVYYKYIEDVYYPNAFRLLREDSLAKKIYALSSDSTTESLLYDYSLVVGDTFNGVSTQIVLDSIRNTIIDDPVCFKSTPPTLNFVAPKVFYFHPIPINPWNNTPVVWVEGVGSLVTLMSNDWEWSDLSGYKILCHYDGEGNRDYHYTSCEVDTCLGSAFNSLEETAKLENKLKTSPNPVDSEMQIEFLNKTTGLERMNLYDLLGKKLFSVDLATKRTIDFVDLEKGCYIGIFYFENGQTVSRTIIKK